jgi:uncharacterized membrane protein YfcA
MDVFSLDLTIFLVATFAGALVAGLSGFAFGLVAASIWLYILTPLQTATLIIAFGLIVQGYSVWKLRHALEWAKLWPFILGATIGVAVGIAILGWANPAHVRASIGVFLVLYSLYALYGISNRWRRSCRRRCRISQRHTRRNNRTCGHIGDDLVRPARLAERSAAHDLSAGCGCDLRHERRVAGHQGFGIGGYHPAVSVRIARTARWDVVRYEALWPPRRNRIPKSRVGPLISSGAVLIF